MSLVWVFMVQHGTSMPPPQVTVTSKFSLESLISKTYLKSDIYEYVDPSKIIPFFNLHCSLHSRFPHHVPQLEP